MLRQIRKIGAGTGAVALSKYRLSLADVPALLLLIYGIAALAYLSVISWNQPALDLHGFRQAQTAISAYWLAKGGPWFLYQTPVLGAPWSVPFEFPLYQWLVAVLAGTLPLTVDQAGRLIGVAFVLGTAAVVFCAVRRVCGSRTPALFAAGAMLTSPLILFWSRAVMIESAALFFSVLFVHATVAFHQLRDRRRVWAVLMVSAAWLAALIKITTFFGFAVFLAAGLLVRAARCRDRAAWMALLPTLVMAAVAVLSALAALKIWLVFADAAKMQTILGGSLTSASLGVWNYGTLAQRMDPGFWDEVVFGRALVEGLGHPWLLSTAILVLVYERQHLGWLFLLCVGYLAPYLAFANLHWVHNYYQYANVVFLSLTLALALWLLARSSLGGAGVAMLAALLVCELSWAELGGQFVPAIRQDHRGDRVMELAGFLRGHTGGEQAVLVFGLDWSSELPYYAERRALMMPDWASSERLLALADRNAAFAGTPVGAVIVCPNALAENPASADAYRQTLTRYTAGLSAAAVAGCTVHYAAASR